MAVSINSDSTRPSLSEINVTPLVDVVLVLLIIFMITAPILQTGIEVQLPRSQTAKAVEPDQQAVITISREELLFFQSELFNFNELGRLLKENTENDRQAIFVRAHEEVRWKTLVTVIDEIRASGYEEIKIVTRPYEGKP